MSLVFSSLTPIYTVVNSGFIDAPAFINFLAHLKPKICSLAKYMFSEGVEKIALVGFSWSVDIHLKFA